MNRRDRAGFTLAELLAVVAVLAILVAIAIPVFGASRDKAAASACLSNRRSAYGVQRVAVLSGTLKADASSDQVMAYVGSGITCPGGGTITFDPTTGSFVCDLHGGDGETGDGSGSTDPVPDIPANPSPSPDTPEEDNGSEESPAPDASNVLTLITNAAVPWPESGASFTFSPGDVVTYDGIRYVVGTDISITNEWNWRAPSGDDWYAVPISDTPLIHTSENATSGITLISVGDLYLEDDGSVYIRQYASGEHWTRPSVSIQTWLKITLS